MNHIVLIDNSMAELADIRRWLASNIKQRWTATNRQGEKIDWRRISKCKNRKQKDWLEHVPVTTMIKFKRPDDMMLFLQKWSGRVCIDC